METLPTHDQKISETLIRNPSEKGLNPKFSETSRRPTYTICLKLWYSLFLLFSVSFNVVFVVHLMRHGSEDQEICGPEILNQVCLSCKYFEDSKTFLWMKQRQRWRRIKEEKDTCCFEYTESLHEMSKIFFLEHMSSASYQAANSTRPMAHLTLNPTTAEKRDMRLRWTDGKNKKEIAFMNHVQYVDDKMVVPEAGSYYIYSFITFRFEHIQNDTFLNHYLYKDRENQTTDNTEMLFMDKQMRHKGNLEFQTSLLAGIVNLQSRDRIFTEVSDVSAVYRSSLTNYMGIFKL